MLLGYARVSTNDQDSAARVAALKAAGCERIYREKTSGGRWDRPELHRLLDQVRKGDVLVVWKLDRLSRSLRDLPVIMERLRDAKAGFRSLTEAIDTTAQAGRMLMQVLGSFAEFERIFPKAQVTLQFRAVPCVPVHRSDHADEVGVQSRSMLVIASAAGQGQISPTQCPRNDVLDAEALFIEPANCISPEGAKAKRAQHLILEVRPKSYQVCRQPVEERGGLLYAGCHYSNSSIRRL